MAPPPSKNDWSITIPTLVGSLLSFLGAGFILICYMILPQKRHFRHALIINLAVADFINATNNSFSGLWIVIRNRKIQNGPACVANGFIGQLSVQATDCSILMIAVVTMLFLKQASTAQDATMRLKVLLCCSTWLLPLITAFTALGMHLYHPVGGNWCWIQQKPTYLRYVLTHMWRFMVIAASTGIYIYIYIFLQRHFKNVKVIGNRSYGDGSQHSTVGPRDAFARRGSAPRKESYGFRKLSEASTDSDARSMLKKPVSQKHKPTLTFAVTEEPMDHDLESRDSPAQPNTRLPSIPMSDQRIRPLSTVEIRRRETETRIKRAFLLNAYPIMYIILWIPGIMNRIAEASGHPTHVLAILQSSTQFVGLANAITYGMNEKIWKKLHAKFFSSNQKPVPRAPFA